jgi:hypothetical protein
LESYRLRLSVAAARDGRKEDEADDDAVQCRVAALQCRNVARVGGRGPGLVFRRLVSAQAVVKGGDLRQRKISERGALVIGRKQNDFREHVANLADNLEQDCVLYVCHGPNRDPFRSSKSSRLIGLLTLRYRF